MTGGSVEAQAKVQLGKQVVAALDARFPAVAGNSEIYTLFRLFWRQLALSDWQHKEVTDIAGCICSLWMLLCQPEKRTHVSVLNPTLEENGWLCSGTAIMVCQADMPFLVDSLRMEISRRSWPIHAIKSTLLATNRDEQGNLLGLKSVDEPADSQQPGTWRQEALIYLEVGLITQEAEMVELQNALQQVLAEVEQVVLDYRPMLEKTALLKENLGRVRDGDTADESRAFLQWIMDGHFTFLGYREFDLNGTPGKFGLVENEAAALGAFRKSRNHPADEQSPSSGILDFYAGTDLIAFSKSATRSRVHRDVYPDYVVVKRHNEDGEVIGEGRLLGLFTYSVYTLSPMLIPLIRHKVQAILDRSELLPMSHDGKNLRRVLETFPREELFQADPDELYETALGVARISERRVIRLFSRKDTFEKFVNCIVYVPRDLYNTRIRQKIEQIIAEAINASGYESTTYFSESSLARAHMVFRIDQSMPPNVDWASLEANIVQIARGWDERFESALVDYYGEANGLRLARLYAGAFSAGYQENYDARVAVQDIRMMESLSSNSDIAMHFFHGQGQPKSRMRFKVMRLNIQLELSDVIPVLEHLGMRVLGEHPFKIRKQDGGIVWMHEFDLNFSLNTQLEVASVSKLFEVAFAAIWHGKAESDAFNRLVLGARLNWREVVMLRAYAAYMKQTAFNFSKEYIADTLASQLEVTRNLVALFKANFEPRLNEDEEKAQARIQRLRDKILQGLEAIQNLNEDKILRRYYEFISATLRTNFYQKNGEGQEKEYLSFKFSPRELSDIPKPKPLFEIFVYSPRVEGVHLRGGRVARGGIRWSDRLQDYRTEVLGLVKAQQVKNAVIVPTGAKGGFVAKCLPSSGSRDEIAAEAVSCYKIFIRGLLDLTDNYVGSELVGPKGVICRDPPDPYLVVAADKGTATFSDTANAISLEYGHWLGDAFASGGSQGYDHKKMGITARGGWISVQRHFRELGIDVQKDEFTVVGIGDMSGDVFGNGMLRSDRIRLVAAFNHLHIFVDPSPDPAAGFAERKRLFETPRTGWADYDERLISEGGGVFSRSAKSIALTPQMQRLLGVDADRLAPNDLVSAILKAPVDLLWNGGIGTYVKSATETHAAAGDKANDAVRVNGGELRCRVIGEGGNLGMTQLGRMEYALGGGACNTDFIDNSAGVDCSDHEVNIKILLDELIAAGDLTPKQRNSLLASMTDEVASLVLRNNYRQTLALSVARHQGTARINEHRRFIQYLEGEGKLDRALEYLPRDEELNERGTKGIPLTRPELAVLMCYSKVVLKEILIDEDIAADPYARSAARTAFPATIAERFPEKIVEHRLIKEIVATQVANDLVNSLGITGAHRLTASTGASCHEVAIAFMVAKDIFDFEEFRRYMKTLDTVLPAETQLTLFANMVRRIRRGARWLLRNRHNRIKPSDEVDFFKEGIRIVNAEATAILNAEARQSWLERRKALAGFGIEEPWLAQLVMPGNLYSGLSVVEVARITGAPVKEVMGVFVTLYEQLRLHSFASRLSEVKVESSWQALAREAFLDDLDKQLRKLALRLVEARQRGAVPPAEDWLQLTSNTGKRWLAMVTDLENSTGGDFAMFSVAVKELVDLAGSPEWSRPSGLPAG